MNATSDADKLDNLNKATTAAQQAFQAGLTEPLFDANELRAMAGFEPRADDGMPEEGDLEVDPNEGAPGTVPVDPKATKSPAKAA